MQNDLLLQNAYRLHGAGQLRAAGDLYERILSTEPNHAAALMGKAAILHQAGDLEAALAVYDKIIAGAPDFAEAHARRGVAYSMLEKHEEALADYDEAVKRDARNPGYWSNRGNALFSLGRHDDAVTSYDNAVALEPRYAEAHFNKGMALAEGENLEAALAAFTAALAADPSYADALEYRANVLIRLKRFDEALAAYDSLLPIRTSPEILFNRANALSVLKRFEEAVADAEAALERNPDYPYARGVLAHSKLSVCDWKGLDKVAAEIESDLRTGKRSLSPFEYLALCPSPEQQLSCAEIWTADVCPEQMPLWRGERYQHERIRVAYLSADFRNHPVAALMAGVFEAHDRARFETIAVSFTPEHTSPLRTRLEAAFDRFADVRTKGDAEIAGLLREWEIDIAVDLMGHTRECRTGILARRPAPIQVNYLGFPGTMGASYIDYIIADPVVVPEAHRRFYREQVVHLPGSYLPHDSRRTKPASPPSRHEAGLPESGFVYCCFNGSYKFSPFMFDIWMRLLCAVEGSVLWLSDPGSAAARNLRREAESRGVSGTRIVFAPFVNDDSDHLARLGLADLFLDTSPYGAHTTASDALWAGVPVLTFAGETFAGRVAASLLRMAGLPELVAPSLESYEKIALDLARNPERLSGIRERLASSRETTPLFDTNQICRSLEAAFAAMVQRHRDGAPPESFAVP